MLVFCILTHEQVWIIFTISKNYLRAELVNLKFSKFLGETNRLLKAVCFCFFAQIQCHVFSTSSRKIVNTREPHPYRHEKMIFPTTVICSKANVFLHSRSEKLHPKKITDLVFLAWHVTNELSFYCSL